MNESSLVRNKQDNDFNSNNLTNINLYIIITSNTQVIIDNQVITKAYVDHFHQETERSRRDLGINIFDESSDQVKNNQNNNVNDNKLINLISVSVNRSPISDKELTNKKYVDDELDKNTILRFNQTLQNYLKLSVGNDTYNLTKYDKIQFIDLTEIKPQNTGTDLLQKWKIDNNIKNGDTKCGKFLKSTKMNSPT